MKLIEWAKGLFKPKLGAAETPLAIVCPDFVTSGEYFTVTVTIRNDGPETWLANGAGGWALGSQLPQDNGTWGAGRWFLPTNVSPGQTVTVPLACKAPTLDPSYSQPPIDAHTPLPLFSGALPDMPIPFGVRMVQDGGVGCFRSLRCPSQPIALFRLGFLATSSVCTSSPRERSSVRGGGEPSGGILTPSP